MGGVLEGLADSYHLLPQVAEKISSGPVSRTPLSSGLPSKRHLEQLLPMICGPLSSRTSIEVLPFLLPFPGLHTHQAC